MLPSPKYQEKQPKIVTCLNNFIATILTICRLIWTRPPFCLLDLFQHWTNTRTMPLVGDLIL
ncbi:unnamed protein product, partial [Vitis vinifera]